MSWLVCAERVSFTAKSMSIIYIHSRLLGSNTFSNAALHVLKPEKPKTRPDLKPKPALKPKRPGETRPDLNPNEPSTQRPAGTRPDLNPKQPSNPKAGPYLKHDEPSSKRSSLSCFDGWALHSRP